MKKVLLFILLQVLWICLLVGADSLYHNSLSSKMGPRIITIIGGDLQSNRLTLVPAADILVPVEAGEKVVWKIDPSSNVKSFSIEMKDTSTNIFWWLDPPPRNHTTNGGGKVKGRIDNFTVFSYNILWKAKSDQPGSPDRRFDPKLAVNPSRLTLIQRLIYIVYAVLCLATFLIFRRNKIARGQ